MVDICPGTEQKILTKLCVHCLIIRHMKMHAALFPWNVMGSSNGREHEQLLSDKHDGSWNPSGLIKTGRSDSNCFLAEDVFPGSVSFSIQIWNIIHLLPSL